MLSPVQYQDQFSHPLIVRVLVFFWSCCYSMIRLFEPDATIRLQLATGYINNLTQAPDELEISSLSVFDQIVHEKADITPPIFSLTPERAKLMANIPLLASKLRYAFIFNKPSQESASLNFSKFLGNDLLYSVSFTLLIVLISHHFLRMLQSHFPGAKHLLNKFWKKSGVVFGFFYGLFLGYFSTKVVLMFNIAPTTSVPFSNFPELAIKLRSGEFRAVAWSASTLKVLQPSENIQGKIFENLRSAALKHEPIFEHNFVTAIQMVQEAEYSTDCFRGRWNGCSEHK